MKFAPLSIAAILASAAPAWSQTPEKTATTIGYVVESYARNRVFCLATGFAMPTMQEALGQSQIEVAERAKRDYPEFYRLGAARAVRETEELSSEIASVICPMLAKEMLKRKS